MADPFRLKVQKRLSEELQAITPENGFEHDLTQGVFRGRSWFGPDDPVPMISILEEPKEADRQAARPRTGVTRGPYELLVQGFAQDDHENPTDPAHHLMADVQKRLAEVVETSELSGKIFSDLSTTSTVAGMNFGGGVVRPPDEEVSAKAYFWLRVTFDLVEDHRNPRG